MITVAQVKDALEMVAAGQAEGGDARVARNLAPRYVEHGQPCCLVAVILHELKFTVPQLRQLDAEPGKGGGGVVFSESRHPLVKRIAPGARQLLDYLQRWQDQGSESWADLADRALQRGKYTPHRGTCSPWHRDHVARRWAYETFPWNEVTDGDAAAST